MKRRKNCPNVKLLLKPSQIDITITPRIMSKLTIKSVRPIAFAPVKSSSVLGSMTACISFGAEENSFLSRIKATAENNNIAAAAQNTTARNNVKIMLYTVDYLLVNFDRMYSISNTYFSGIFLYYHVYQNSNASIS